MTEVDTRPRQPHVVLASASPRRAELLRQVGVTFRVAPMAIDESPRSGEAPDTYVRRIALEKARAGWQATAGPPPVLGADTAVVLDGHIFGKPRDREDGVAMLAGLSGRRHRVYSAVALVAGSRAQVVLSCNEVTLRRISAAEREAYWATGEPCDKAGGYAIQGLGAMFVTRLQGSYSGVMGLPLYETTRLLREFGMDCLLARDGG